MLWKQQPATQLPHRFQAAGATPQGHSFEFGRLIEEKHAMVHKADRTGLRNLSASDECPERHKKNSFIRGQKRGPSLPSYPTGLIAKKGVKGYY